MIIAIDPGNKKSGFVEWDGKTILNKGNYENQKLLKYLEICPSKYLFIEQVVCMGQPVGKEVFDTVFWSGRFYQVWEKKKDRLITELSDTMIPRTTIKSHHRAKNDKEIRAVLIKKYGKITKNLTTHEWQAFALATWVSETGLLENS